MEKIWLAHFPQGVPAEVDPKRYSAIPDLAAKSCARFGTKPAYTCMGTTLSFADIDRLSQHFASYLVHGLKLAPGDRIAIQMPNILQYPVVLFGALRAGLVVVNTNPLYTPREMAHQFKDSGAKAIVIVANFAHNLEAVLADTQIEHVIVTELGDLLKFPKNLVVNLGAKYLKKLVPAFNLPKAVSFSAAMKQGAGLPKADVTRTHDDIAFLQYTGGTTGVSKGAVLTHGNVLANVEQMAAWVGPRIAYGEEIIITPLPLYHVFSLTVNCLAFMHFGGHNILITNPRDMPAFVKELSAWRFTVLTGVNTLFNGLLNNPEFAKLDFRPVKLVVGGAMAVQRAVAERWKQTTGTVLVEGYGLTESSPVVACNPIDQTEQIGTIGMPMPSTEISLRDDAGNEVPMGEPGELCVRGPQVMVGYYNRPEETAKSLTDGWLRTGDMATVAADGFFKIVDRKKDMIIVSGFNVYPNEVEDVIATHPKVLEVAVVGVEDAKCGESVKAFVVKKDASLTSEELIAYCRQELTAYKIPRSIEFRDELPKTNVGKILRRALKEAPAKV